MDIDEIIEYHSGPFSVVHHRGEQVAVLSNSGAMFFLGNKNACDLLNAYAALKAENADRIAALEAALRDMLKAQTMTLGPRTAEIIRMAEEVLRGNPPLPEGK